MEMVEKVKEVPVKTTRGLTEDELDEMFTLGAIFGTLDVMLADVRAIIESLNQFEQYTKDAEEALKKFDELEATLSDVTDDYLDNLQTKYFTKD